jgi:hypothetical protein
MANILGLAAIAGNAAQDQVIARRKDQVLQEEEADARSKREEFAARRGLRDNAAAFEGERVTQGRKDFGKSAADKQAVQDAIKKAAADFASQNPYRSAAEPVADNSATSEVTASPAPQSAVGIAPEMLAPTPGTVAAPVTMAAGGITAAAPAAVVRAQTVSTPSAKPTDPSHGMERAAYIAQAAADQHLANGDMASYKQASDDAIHMRDALRAERFNKADALYAQTGDATVYTKLIYPLFNDGYSLVEAKQVSGADGKPVLSMTRRNNQTGDVETKTSTVDQFLNGIKEIRRPGTLAALEERIAAEKRDVANQIEKGAPALKNAMDIAKMNDVTHRIAANASAANSYAAAGLHNAQAATLKSSPPIWNDKADAYLEKNYAIKDDSGAVTIDGDGMQFAKKLAIGQAKANGGDTVSGLGYAFDVDNRLKERVADAVKADPKANPKALLRAERANYLKILTAPKDDAWSDQPAAAPAKPGKVLASEGLPKPASKMEKTPSYEGWMATKSKIDKLKEAANNMSADRREAYLSSRLPDLEDELKFHSEYKKY